MAVNTVGAVPVLDGGTPRTITVLNPVGVTGGQFVYLSGGNNVVGSSWDGFSPGSVLIAGVASGAQFNGIVLTPGNTASGTASYVTLATAGTFIVTADGSVFGGYPVMVAGNDSVQMIGSLGGTALNAGLSIGRALTNAQSGTSNYAVVSIRGQ